MMESQSKYWDDVWIGRTDEDNPFVVNMNVRKMQFLLHCLSKKPEYEHMKKLDIGCGTGIHVGSMVKIFPAWADKYKGLDLSERAINRAKIFNLNAEVANFYTYKDKTKYDLFLMLDSLEHFEDHQAVAEKIKELGSDRFTVFGNIPMYESTIHAEGGFERPMSLQDMVNFFGALGIKKFWQRIYGSFGHPYMVFEGVYENTNS